MFKGLGFKAEWGGGVIHTRGFLRVQRALRGFIAFGAGRSH